MPSNQFTRVEKLVGDCEDWTEVETFGTNWANYTASSDFNTAGYYKDPFNVVTLKGLVTHTTGGGGTTVFTLPTGYIPTKQLVFISDAGFAFARVDVNSDGTVDLQTGNAVVYLTLEGISFRV